MIQVCYVGYYTRAEGERGKEAEKCNDQWTRVFHYMCNE